MDGFTNVKLLKGLLPAIMNKATIAIKGCMLLIVQKISVSQSFGKVLANFGEEIEFKTLLFCIY